jgi:hypothetical protein
MATKAPFEVGSVAWLWAVHEHNAASLPVSLLFLHALAVAAWNALHGFELLTSSGGTCSNEGGVALLLAVVITTLGCLAAACWPLRNILDVLRDDKMREVMLAFHNVGLLFMTWGRLGGQGSWVLLTIGVLISSENFQIFRKYENNEESKAGAERAFFRDPFHMYLLVLKNIAHHLGSFVSLPNLSTTVFVFTWRFVSITPHMLQYLNKSWRTPRAILDLVGWGRFYLCVGLFQPLAILAVAARFGFCACLGAFWGCADLGAAADAWLVPIGEGLCANASGHASYLVFRVAMLEKQRKLRNAGGLPERSPGAVPLYGRERGQLEAEEGLLVLGAVILLLAPAPLLILSTPASF